MPNLLTSNSDFSVQFSEDTLNRMLILSYFSGTFPRELKDNFAFLGTVGSYDVALRVPALSLRFDLPNVFDAAVRVKLRFEGTIDVTEPPASTLIGRHKTKGELQVILPLIVVEDENVFNVMVNLPGLREKDITVGLQTVGNANQQVADQIKLLIVFGVAAQFGKMAPLSVFKLPKPEVDEPTGKTTHEGFADVVVRTKNSLVPAEIGFVGMYWNAATRGTDSATARGFHYLHCVDPRRSGRAGETRDAALKDYVESFAYWAPNRATAAIDLIAKPVKRDEVVAITLRS